VLCLLLQIQQQYLVWHFIWLCITESFCNSFKVLSVFFLRMHWCIILWKEESHVTSIRISLNQGTLNFLWDWIPLTATNAHIHHFDLLSPESNSKRSWYLTWIPWCPSITWATGFILQNYIVSDAHFNQILIMKL